MSEATENTENTENKQEEEQKTSEAAADEYGEFAKEDDFAKDDVKVQNEYGEFASEGMEGVNETIADETGEVRKERDPVGFTGSQPLNFLICSVIGTILFAIYMDWEKKQKNKKPEGVTEVNKTGWKQTDKTADDWKKSGNQLFKEKDYEGAIVDYTMAINLAKQAKTPSAIYHVNRANAYFELKKSTECLNDCTAAKEIDPSYAKTYWRVAKIMELQLDKRDVAFGVLKNAVSLKCFELSDTTNAFTKYYRQLEEDIQQFAIYPKNDPTRNMFKVHMYWIQQLGADLSKVTLKYLPNQLPSLFMDQALDEGCPIATFRQPLIVSLQQMGEEVPAIKHLLKLQAEGESITQYEIAPLWFIHASRTPSHTYEMYSHIVQMTSHLYPANFGDEEAKYYAGSKLGKEIKARKEHIKMCYNRIRAYLFQNNKIDFQFGELEYQRYWQLGLTRGFTYPSGGDGSPMTWGINILQNNVLRGDPFGANCMFMKNGDIYGIVSVKPLKAGEELRYGAPAQGNGHLQYLTTGCVENDWFDRILIKTDITIELDSETTPHYELKKALLLSSANRKELNIFQCMGNQNLFKLLIAWARFVVYEGDIQRLTDANNDACSEDPTEYPLGQTLHKLDGFHGFNLFPRCLREEQKVWALLEKTAKQRMNEYSRINEDVELKKEGLKRNIKNILLIRQQEKMAVNQLGFVSFNFMQELAKAQPNFDNFDAQIRTGFRYQEYCDSIKNLPLTVEDPESEASEEEVSDHDQADDNLEAPAETADIEEVEEMKPVDAEEKEVDGGEEEATN